MKFKQSVKKVLIASSLCLGIHTANAAEFTCPVPQELKEFKGFSIEYPISMDVQKMQPYNWMVLKVGHKKDERSVSSFLVTPIITADQEGPSDTALRMLDNFEPQADYKECETIHPHLNLCGCVYINKNDGSLLTFIRAKYGKEAPVEPEKNMQYSTKIMQNFYKIKNNAE